MKFWYQPQLTFRAALLYPLSRLYRKLAYRNYAKGMKFASYNPQARALQVPVIVVGNITVGGTGKTPMVRFLIGYLNAMGFKVGVVSRGYGGSYTGVHHLQVGDSATLVGDEMAMQFAYCQRQNLKVEFVVCRERIKAALKCQELGVDFIISDDGLQHYALPRHLEIALIGPQALGNRQFIPAGPLREDISRLRHVDFIINNSSQREWGGYKMTHNSFALVPVHAISQPCHGLFDLTQLSSSSELEQHLALNWLEFLAVVQPEKLLPLLQTWQTQLQWDEHNSSTIMELAQELLQQIAAATIDGLDGNLEATTANDGDSSVRSYTTDSWNRTLEQVHASGLVQFMHAHAQELELAQIVCTTLTQQGTSESPAKEVNSTLTCTTTAAPSLRPTTCELELTQGCHIPSLRLYQETFAAINSTFSQRLQDTAYQAEGADRANLETVHSWESQTTNHTPVESTSQVYASTAPSLQVNSQEFQQFLNKQFCLETASYQEFITKSLTRLSPIHILPSLFQTTFPQVVALSAIGYPQGFTQTLQEMGFTVVGELVFGDHHNFTQAELDQIYNQHPQYRGLPLVCTEKDAIKLQHLKIPAPTFFVEREGLFLEHPRWLDQLKDKIVTIYNNGK